MLRSAESADEGRSLILTLAPQGPSYSTVLYPSIPTDPHDVLTDSAAAFDLGFRRFHLHARNPDTGRQYASGHWYDAVFRGIRAQNPGAVVGGATSRKGDVELQIAQRVGRAQRQRAASLSVTELARIESSVRGIALEAQPDWITTFTPPEIKMAQTVGDDEYREIAAGYSEVTRTQWTRPEVMRAYYRNLRQQCHVLDVGEELELTTEVALPVVERMADDPTLGLPRNVLILFLFGYSARLPIARTQYDRALNWVERLERQAGVNAHVTVGCAIAPNAAARVRRRRREDLPAGLHDIREVFEWAAHDERVDSFRVGLEDVVELYGTKVTNLDLAQHTRELCDEYGVRVETDPDKVRARFSLTSPVAAPVTSPNAFAV
jgi:uncharacterized protein (DUF849 family)